MKILVDKLKLLSTREMLLKLQWNISKTVQRCMKIYKNTHCCKFVVTFTEN